MHSLASLYHAILANMFVYVLVNPGMEPWLKAEAAFRHPELKLSYSRPGLVTFKAPEGRGEPHFWFSRVSGIFRVKTAPASLDTELNLWSEGRTVHRTLLAHQSSEGTIAQQGDQVLDVLDLGQELWLGTRTVKPFTWGHPGGLPGLALPAQAPSRAWLKATEQLLWSGWEAPVGSVAVELGSAPGGASWALLQQGFQVTGVDLAAMDKLCLDHRSYSHVTLSVRDLRKKHLPVHIDALFCDLGLSPVEAIPQIRELSHVHPEISWLFYTLKLGQKLPMEQLQKHLDSLHALGFTLRCTHLPSNKSELTVVGFRGRVTADVSGRVHGKD